MASSRDDEYRKMFQRSGAVVTMVDEARSSVDEVVANLRQLKLDDLYANLEELDATQATAMRANKLLLGSGRFLVEDVNVSLQELGESLEKYRKMLMAKLGLIHFTSVCLQIIRKKSVLA